ncbi:MAG TPA: branched-chain amino acid ABC transporter permease [Candidatus Deferrimicrobium sp.]|nr:branched-chain amino acid ABC transporter permease [Candidatus Deferrimicrobium sp.]
MRNILTSKNILITAILLAFFAATQFAISQAILPPFFTLNLMLICIYIILSVSLNLINGFTGQFSIGHAGFMSVGAYFSAIITVKLAPKIAPLIPLADPKPVLLLIGLILGAIIAGLTGFLIGLPTLRLKGDYLAIATLGFGEIVRIVFLNSDYLGRASGLIVPKSASWPWFFFIMVISVIIIKNFVTSTHGRACISIRENEIAAEAMGINTTRYKVMAFSIGALFAGLAGGLYANYMFIIQPMTFGFLKSFDILVMVVLGGMGSITGSIVGAIMMTFISAALADYPQWRLVITAVLLVVMMLFRPQGLLGNKELSLNFLGKKGGRNGAA